MMTLEWGGKPQFAAWPDAPKYRTLNLSQLIDNKESILKSKMYLKVNLDIDVSYEEATFIKETFVNEHDIREFSMIQEKISLDEIVNENVGSGFESVDQIVSQGLVNIESEQFNQKLLLEIYNSL